MADLYANSATGNRPRDHRLPRYRSAQSIQYDGTTMRKAKGTQDQLVPCTAQHQFAMANIMTHPGA